MTSTVKPPPPSPDPPAPRSPGRAWLVIGLPIALVLLVVAVLAVVAAPLLARSPVDLRYSGAAAPDVRVAVPNARMDLAPSSDGRVHVHVTGWSHATPTIRVRTLDGRTTVQGGCPAVVWFDACDLRLTVALPPASDTTVHGNNGAITARGLAGAFTAATSNGAVHTDAMRGALDLRSSNGEIVVTRGSSTTVLAETSNGAVSLTLLTTPDEVSARTTNGAVSIAVPSTVAYAVSTGTTNGTVDTSGIRTDPASAHRIEARTTNGSVRLVPSGR